MGNDTIVRHRETEHLAVSHTILYIEDETAIIELLTDVLEHPDVNLVCVSNADEGLKKLRDLKPDLVILDVIMPDRSGWSIHEEIRADKTFKSVPVIMLTGQLHRYRIMRDFAKSPIDAYITKPFDVRSLRNEIEKMLDTPIWSGQIPKQAKQQSSPHPPNGVSPEHAHKKKGVTK
jgi:DNA-binding response OmpR family regulator